MKVIVYTSNTGHTAEYSKMLGAKIGLPVYTLNEAKKKIQKGTEIIYLGWLFANNIKGYKKATKKYKISAICAVGLCDTGTAVAEVRKANSISEETPPCIVKSGVSSEIEFALRTSATAVPVSQSPTAQIAETLYFFVAFLYPLILLAKSQPRYIISVPFCSFFAASFKAYTGKPIFAPSIFEYAAV